MTPARIVAAAAVVVLVVRVGAGCATGAAAAPTGAAAAPTGAAPVSRAVEETRAVDDDETGDAALEADAVGDEVARAEAGDDPGDAAVFYSDFGDHERPRCLVGAGVRSNLFFRWNDADRYARTMEVRRDRRPCSAWRAVVREPAGWTALPMGATHALGRPLPVRLGDELEQVRRGANELRAADLDEESVLDGPFTVDANQGLTARFGHGFTGEVYARSITSQPQNQGAHAFLERSMRAQLAVDEAVANAAMQRIGKGVVVLVSMGYGWDETVDEDTVGYVKDFIQTVQALGADVEVMERNTYGGLAENAALLAPKVRAHLAAGKDVILFGLCKGSPELYAATASVLAPYLDAERTQARRPAGWGQVRGVLNMSGMMSGILFSDQLGGYGWALELLGGAMTWLPGRELQANGRYLAILPSLTSEKVAAFKATFEDGLPSDAVYLDVVGVVPEDGILKDDIGAMQPLIEMDRDGDVAKAANDGFIVYPGNQMKPGLSRHQYAVVMSGSHMLFDGGFGGLPMSDLRNERALFRAAIQLVLAPPSNGEPAP